MVSLAHGDAVFPMSTMTMEESDRSVCLLADILCYVQASMGGGWSGYHVSVRQEGEKAANVVYVEGAAENKGRS